MENGVDVRSGVVDGRVECESGVVHTPCGAARLDDAAFRVDLDEAGRGDFGVQESEWIDQKMPGVLFAPDLWSIKILFSISNTLMKTI